MAKKITLTILILLLSAVAITAVVLGLIGRKSSNDGLDADSSQDATGDDETGDADADATQWSSDDDYHWHTEDDKALHTVDNGACSVCAKAVTHTVGLDYELVTPQARSRRAAVSPSDDGYELNGSYYVIKGIGSEVTDENIDLVIPATYNGIPVKEIGEKAFYYHGSGQGSKFRPYVKSVTLPEGLEKIGASSFSLTDITSLTIPSTVTFIGEYAFSYCDLVSVVIPKTVTLSSHTFGGSMVIYSEWTAEEHKDIDKAEVYFGGCTVFYYLEDFTAALPGEHCWHYESDKIVEYTNWQGVSNSEYFGKDDLDGLVYWRTRDERIVCTVKSFEGNDVEIEVTIERDWWDIDKVMHTDKTTIVFDENGEAVYTTDLYYYDIPADYSDNVYPGPGWINKHYTLELKIFKPEIEYMNGKIYVGFAIHMGVVKDEAGEPVFNIRNWTFQPSVRLG